MTTMTPELPLAADWVSQGVCSPHGSIHYDVPESKPSHGAGPSGDPAPPAPQGRSQLATLHAPGRTASLAGASIGQVFLQRRSCSEGTVQVQVAGEQALTQTQNNQPASPRPATASPDLAALPASSAAVQAAPRDFRNAAPLPSSNAAMGGGRAHLHPPPEPEDSNTAVSQAPRAAGGRGHANGALPATAQLLGGCGQAKPTDSFSSAAADALPPEGGALQSRPAAAASLFSHKSDGGGAAGRTPAAAAAAAATPAAAEEEGDADPRQPTAQQVMGTARVGSSGVLLTPATAAAAGLTPLQLQSVVSAALGRRHSGTTAARAAVPGDSSNSGNRPLVLVGLKRKKPPSRGGSAAGRRPMAPPSHLPRAPNQHQQHQHPTPQGGQNGGPQPTASSPGVPHQPTDIILTVEDAVSMVEHGLEAADLEVACDAVSKASGELQQQLLGEEAGTGGGGGARGSACPSLAGPQDSGVQ